MAILQWPVENIELFREALVHSSYAHETGVQSNERLEFLGDAVLELVISEYFFKIFPFHPEGKLTLMRHNTVNEKSLAQIACGLNLGCYIHLGKGEHRSGGAKKSSLLAGALEALVGALFLDQGYQRAKTLIIALFEPLLGAIKQGEKPLLDYKTMLQEICQSKLGKPPFYEITAEFGPSHDRNFRAEVKIGDRVMGEGEGKSKKGAEQSAARAAWESQYLKNNYFTGMQENIATRTNKEIDIE